MIPFKNRFHGHNSLNYVYKNGQAVRSRFLTIKAALNKQRTESRVAVVVGKKVLKSAVGRNRIRRRIYEYVRVKLPTFQKTFDVVIIVSSSELATMSAADMTQQLDQLFYQLNL